MAALHLVSQANALGDCLAVASSDDAVLLLQDGVYAGTGPRVPERPLHALEPDVRARGLALRLAGHVQLVDDRGFVSLVERHQPVVTWR